jgi:hypothetical protein
LGTEQQLAAVQARLAAVQEQFVAMQGQQISTGERLARYEQQLATTTQQFHVMQQQVVTTQKQLARVQEKVAEPLPMLMAESDAAKAFTIEKWSAPSSSPSRSTAINLIPAPATLMDENRRAWGRRWKSLMAGLGRFVDQAIISAQEASLKRVDYHRHGFVDASGYSLMDSGAQISTLPRLVGYLPRALLIGILAPFPWQWFDTKGSTGVMRTFAGIEMLVIYLLLPGILVGVWKTVRQRDAAGLFLLAFTLLLACVLSLVVANLGTLFRLRLQFLLPLIMLAPIGHPLSVYRRLYAACRSRLVTPWGRRMTQPERVQPGVQI